MTAKIYNDMTTLELAYYRSEVKARMKPYLFCRLTDAEKRELRLMRHLLKEIDAKMLARQLRLPGF